MEVYEKINLLIQEKGFSKKEFSDKLRNLEPKLSSTNEIPSEKSIYAYLSGRVNIQIELIPFIAEVLEIPEQVLFDSSDRGRMNTLKYLSKDLNSKEKEFLLKKLDILKESGQTSIIPKDIYHSIKDLLVYAPEPFLKKMESALKDYKALTDKLN
jgi:transcriptional regulator with XRE-family HTH domain